jgi:hypothetical protein
VMSKLKKTLSSKIPFRTCRFIRRNASIKSAAMCRSSSTRLAPLPRQKNSSEPYEARPASSRKDRPCELGKNKSAIAAQLFASWKDWTEKNNESTGSARAFYMNLAEHGFDKPKHTMAGALYRGIGVAEREPPPEL